MAEDSPDSTCANQPGHSITTSGPHPHAAARPLEGFSQLLGHPGHRPHKAVCTARMRPPGSVIVYPLGTAPACSQRALCQKHLDSVLDQSPDHSADRADLQTKVIGPAQRGHTRGRQTNERHSIHQAIRPSAETFANDVPALPRVRGAGRSSSISLDQRFGAELTTCGGRALRCRWRWSRASLVHSIAGGIKRRVS